MYTIGLHAVESSPCLCWAAHINDFAVDQERCNSREDPRVCTTAVDCVVTLKPAVPGKREKVSAAETALRRCRYRQDINTKSGNRRLSRSVRAFVAILCALLEVWPEIEQADREREVRTDQC